MTARALSSFAAAGILALASSSTVPAGSDSLEGSSTATTASVQIAQGAMQPSSPAPSAGQGAAPAAGGGAQPGGGAREGGGRGGGDRPPAGVQGGGRSGGPPAAIQGGERSGGAPTTMQGGAGADRGGVRRGDRGEGVRREGGGRDVRPGREIRDTDVRVRSRVGVRDGGRERWRHRRGFRGSDVYIVGRSSSCHRHFRPGRVMRHCHRYGFARHRHGPWR